MESKAPASCHQHLRRLPQGHLLRAAVRGLPAGLSPIPPVFVKRRCPLSTGLASWGSVLPCLCTCDIFFLGGVAFKAGLLGHVVLNTCSFYLLISPRCSKS